MEWEQIKEQFDVIDNRCTEKAFKKNHDYGNAWLGFRLSTLLEIIESKVKRSINLNDLGLEKALVPDKIWDELEDIINYCRFTIIKLEMNYE